jgi:hypothetical protein
LIDGSDAGHRIASGCLRRSQKMVSPARKIVSLQECEETNSHARGEMPA